MIDSKRSSHKSMKIIFHNEDQYENDEIEKSFLNITNKIESLVGLNLFFYASLSFWTY